jgi:hypothetical protein
MAGSTLRRMVPIVAMILFLLPLASASATPRQRGETSLAIRLADWSHTLLAPVEALLQRLRPILEADFMPPGQKPGNDPNPKPGNREGSGTDPHGRP